MFKSDFPLLSNLENYIYFDSAATTLKPQCVIDAVTHYYQQYTSNIHRSVHVLAEAATIEFEAVREKVASFIKADRNEIIFTQNCTDSINQLAQMLGITPDDEVIVSELEHHSNFLPWQARCLVKTIPIGPDGLFDLKQLEEKLNSKTKLVALTYVSNVTGNIQPIKEAIDIAHAYHVPVLVDATQAVAHFPINVRRLDVDYAAFSAHKMLGPSGVGVLYGKTEHLHRLKPARHGGGMVNKIDADHITLKQPPHCFEAGTPNIEGVLGFGAAIDYFWSKGAHHIESHLRSLNDYFWQRCMQTDWIKLPFAVAKEHVPIFTFVARNPEIDLNHFGRILSDTFGIALSVGVQCCQPFYSSRGLSGALRVSLHVYNSKEDIDQFFDAIEQVKLFL